jgi:formate--tetrahydrofolate ligase
MTASVNSKLHSDVEIANETKLRKIIEVAADLGLSENDIDCYGKYKSKISYSAIERILSDKRGKRGKLILVTAITPTKAGDGKTTSAIGLAQALRKRKHLTVAALREPSMGPVFGQKGGGTGGG